MARRRGRLVAAQDFNLRFDGPAVADGRIPVRDLAPSLLALGDLFELAREVAEPDLPEIGLEVRSFKKGSFDNLLGLAIEGTVGILVADPASALTNLLTLVTHGKHGVLAVARALSGLRPTDRQPVEDKRDYSIGKNNRGQQINAPNSVWNVYTDPRSFELFSGVLGPLRKPGLDELVVTNPEEPLVVRKPEVQDMAMEPEAAEQIEGVEVGRSERKTVLSIVQAPLKHPADHKWKFNEGMDLADFWAKVTHRSWLNDLQNHVRHLDIGDRIKCRLVQIQKEHPTKGLQLDFEVVEVLDHLGPPARPQQDDLF